MPIREIDHDPRTPGQKRGDQKILESIEKGRFPTVSPAARKEASVRLREKRQARGKVAQLGAALGEVRRTLGITQEQLAQALGTQKSNISRLESGRHGGLSMETFLAACGALKSLSGTDPLPSLLAALQADTLRHGIERGREPAELPDEPGSQAERGKQDTARMVHEEPSEGSLREIPELPEGARRVRPLGYFFLRSKNPSNVAPIDADLQELFPTERAVNDALRLFLAGLGQPQPVAEAREGGLGREEREQTRDYDLPLPVVVIHQDLHPFFPDAEAVNRALRAAAELVHQVEARRAS